MSIEISVIAKRVYTATLLSSMLVWLRGNSFGRRIAYEVQPLDRFSLYSLPELPFVHFSVRIPSDPSPDQLSDRYRYLYENAVAAFQDYANRHPEEKLVVSPDGQDGSAMISYNLALTTSSMAICPRRSEATTLKKSEKNVGTSLGPVAVNGTVLAGALMVKTEEEFHKMQRDESNLYSLLQELGIPIERHHDNANEHL